LQKLLNAEGPRLPIYWGNRNWHPILADTIRQMREDGVTNALAFFTSAFSSYSGCRQYRENIAAARSDGAPNIDKLRAFYNHPGFLNPMIEKVRAALQLLPGAHVAFTAHSIPTSMALTSPYVTQLEEACKLVAAGLGINDYKLVYQSRSGPPTQPWLEPDIGDHIRALHAAGRQKIVIAPIGFISDHMEVIYDLDTEAAELSKELGMNMARAATVGTHPDFIRMIRELILERVEPGTPRLTVGPSGPCPDVCPPDCCPPPAARRP
jgi:ferrochelatase